MQPTSMPANTLAGHTLLLNCITAIGWLCLSVSHINGIHSMYICFFYSSEGFCYCFSVAQSCPTLCDPMNCSTPSSSVVHYLWSLLNFMSIESVMLSNHLRLRRPLLLLPSIFPSIRVFSNELALCIRWPKY